MRKQFIEVSTLSAARKLAPWAAVIVNASGGYMAFESDADYQTWRARKQVMAHTGTVPFEAVKAHVGRPARRPFRPQMGKK